jgi:hypothetical protein
VSLKATKEVNELNGKRAIKKNERNWPVKKSIRILKAKLARLETKEGETDGR